MGTPVLVPVNRLDRAKGRLEGFLSPEERRALAAATLQTVVAGALEAGCSVTVLTADTAVPDLLPHGVRVMDESPAATGLNGQLEFAVRELGAQELLVLHADLPLADAAAITTLIRAAAAAPSVTLVESEDGGTNAMLMRPPGRFALAYGKASAALHREAALAAGMPVSRVDVPSLALDLDTPADIAAFVSLPGWEKTRASQVLQPVLPRLEGLFRGAVVADEG